MAKIIGSECVLAHAVGEGSKCLKCKDSCPGLLLHYWRNRCKYCGCSRDEHDVSKSETDQEVPKTRRPYINPPVDHADQKMGEGHVKQRMRQFPVYDEDLDYCGSIKTAEESKMAEIFLNDRKTRRGKGEKRQFEALIDQWICTQCQVLMEPNCFAVFVEHAKGKVWHPECFVCAQCKEQLLDHIYFWNDQEQKVYCGRHDAEKRRPRCTECDELIFGDYTKAEDKTWHIEHFTCFSCDAPLGGKEYVLKDNQQYCCECFAKQFTTKCETCGDNVPFRQCLSAEEGGAVHAWHGSSKCFLCAVCRKSLVDKTHFIKNKTIFCSFDCHRLYKRFEK
ncbi:hypothetical protein EMCRGX_G014935 [Ephydatia muelleri]